MRFQTIGLSCLILLNTSVLTPLTLSIPAPFRVPQALAQTPDQRLSEADRLYQQGDKQIKASQFKQALQSFEAALDIYQKIGNRSKEALTLNYMGLACNNLDKYSQALKLYQQALAIFRQLGDRFNEGTVLSNMGGVYDNLSQYSQALKLYEQALAIRTEVNDRDGEGVTLNSLGLIYRNLGQYEKARDFYQRALAIRRKLGDRFEVGQTLNNLGEVYRNLDQYPKAVELYQEALIIFRKLGNLTRGEGAILNNLGDAYRHQGQYPQALESFQQAAAIFKKIGARVSEGTSIGNIGRVYAQQSQYQKAIEFYQQALAIQKTAGDRIGEVRNLKNMGSALYKSGLLAEATQTLHKAIEIFESLRPGLNDINKVSIFDTQADVYRLQQQALIAQNKTNDALEIAERSRTRAFLELLQARLSAQPISQFPISSSPITLLQKVAKQHSSTIVEYSIIPDNFNIEGKQETRESELFVWVIKPTGEVTFRHVDLSPLWNQQKTSLPELVTISRESIGVRGRGIVVSQTPNAPKAQNRLKQLHQLLIKPIADLLPKDETARIIFIPQSSLFLIPFAALLDEEGKYLIEKHTILTAPSIQVLNLTYQQRQS
ncbi:MAG: tetratricopeptide repeat protein, partial [Rhizonema sp. PD37]|nr:tetratricopeptide repeat protein [Rhizonema sp. PD37]